VTPIGGQQDQVLGLSLRNQHAIKWVAMVPVAT
jgi:hypothetical protein